MKYFLITLLLAGVAFGDITNEGAKKEKVVITDPTTGTGAIVNSSGQLKVVLDGKVDTNNSTTATLDAGATFTGTACEILDYGMVYTTLKSDVASAADGLSLQQSSDGTNWDSTDEYTIAANSGKTFSTQPAMKWFRVVYQNGGTTQSFFRMQTVLKKTDSLASSHRVQDPIVDDDDAELVTNVNKAKKPDGTYVNIGASQSGNLLVSNAENPSAIAFGEVVGKSIIQKFGNAPDFDTGDNEITMWDGANDAGIDNMIYDYSLTADIDSIISSSPTDIGDIEIQGLGASSNLVVQTVTLNGQTRVALATNLYRVFRKKNIGASNLVGDVSCYVTNAPTSSGVVDDSSLVRSLILNGNNQTEMAIYTVPGGEEIVIKGVDVYSAGASRSASYIVTLWARPPDGVFQLKWKGAFSDDVDSGIRKPYETGLFFDEGTDIELRVQVLTAAITAATMSGGFEIEKKEK